MIECCRWTRCQRWRSPEAQVHHHHHGQEDPEGCGAGRGPGVGGRGRAARPGEVHPRGGGAAADRGAGPAGDRGGGPGGRRGADLAEPRRHGGRGARDERRDGAHGGQGNDPRHQADAGTDARRPTKPLHCLTPSHEITLEGGISATIINTHGGGAVDCRVTTAPLAANNVEIVEH